MTVPGSSDGSEIHPDGGTPRAPTGARESDGAVRAGAEWSRAEDDSPVTALRRAALRVQSDAAVGLLGAGLVGYAAAMLGCLGWLARATIELASAASS